MRLFLLKTLTVITTGATLVMNNVAHAAGLGNAAGELRNAGVPAFGQEAVDAAGAPGGLPAIVGSIIQIALLVVGGLFLLLLIYGGYIWMIARGDTEKVKKAKEIITNALIGLVIVFAAYAISAFVVSRIVAATQLQTP